MQGNLTDFDYLIRLNFAAGKSLQVIAKDYFYDEDPLRDNFKEIGVYFARKEYSFLSWGKTVRLEDIKTEEDYNDNFNYIALRRNHSNIHIFMGGPGREYIKSVFVEDITSGFLEICDEYHDFHQLPYTAHKEAVFGGKKGVLFY